MQADVVVVGAGPAGLCFARALSGAGLRIVLVERQPRAALADPADDGREIALTHRSQRLMQAFGLWDRLPDDDIATLRDALVIDGDARPGLRFLHSDAGHPQLGWLVPNHAIRRAAFDAVQACDDVTLLDGVRVRAVATATDGASVTLDDGRRIDAALLVAADSRFSDTRRAMGIAAAMHDFGKTMLVCRMRHAVPHDQTAWEWFGYGQTLALLPRRDPHTSSVVLTLPQAEALRMQALEPEAFARNLAQRFQSRLGAMTFVGPCQAYPLVGVYPQRFTATRFAAIGDAAVGMHPVTAHGFNFGLLGVDTLARALRDAHASGRPIHDDTLLRGYDRAHRLATRPLYLATRLVAGLYTDDSTPARVARTLALGAAARLGPFRRWVMAGLTDDGRGATPLAALRRFATRATARPGS